MQSSLLVGGPGTAKTAIINQFLARFPRETSSAKAITFSYFTAPGIYQRAVEARALLSCCRALQQLLQAQRLAADRIRIICDRRNETASS